MTENQDQSEADLLRFVDLIEQRLGLQFGPTENNRLAALLRERMRETGCSRFSYYEQRVCDGADQELRTLAARLTIPETYFFRNPEKFVALTGSVLPQLYRVEPGRHLRILSAGCSTGEEPFTIAMTLKEMPGFDPSQVSIIGTDVNLEGLERARSGRFSKWSMRTIPEHYRKKYFRPEGDEFVLDDGIRAMVRLEEQNLAEEDPDFWRPDSYDVIFCRNVLMYFSPRKRMEAVARFARAIAADGFLFLAHAETLHGVSRDFHLQHSDGCFYYGRRPLSGERREPAGDAELAPVPAARRISTNGASIPDPVNPGRPASQPETGAAKPAQSVSFALTMGLVQAGRVREALAIIEESHHQDSADPDLIVLKAALLAELGNAKEAAQLCAALLVSDDLNPAAHYLLGFCHEQSGVRARAIESYRTAAYLDPAFAMPHLRLGLLFRRETDRRRARQELAEAALLLVREDPARILLFGNGFNRAVLLELCGSELRLCEGRQ